MFILANDLDGGQDGSHLPIQHKSFVHIRPDVHPLVSVLITPLPDFEV